MTLRRRPPPVPGPVRLVRACDYVEASMDQVREVLTRPGVDELLTSSLEAALGPDRPMVSVTSTPLEVIGRATARMTLTWHTIDAEPPSRGDATLLLVVVHSGSNPLTELVVHLRVEDRLGSRVAAEASRFLDDLTRVLRSACAGH